MAVEGAAPDGAATPGTDGSRDPGCPLCRRPDPIVVGRGRAAGTERRFHHCPRCALVFVDPEVHPDREEELGRYLEHDNDPADPDYRRYLSPAAEAVDDDVPPGSRGLDYGAGPGPALAAMLRERGHEVALFDPFFHPDSEALDGRYAFIACTETVEHFHRPREEFARLDALLEPGGRLVVMTRMYEEPGNVPDWRYSRDITHVCFYHRDTMGWIARWRGWKPSFPHSRVVRFAKPG